MPKTYIQSDQELGILKPREVKLYKDAFQNLCLEIEGSDPDVERKEYSNVKALRSFPLSSVGHLIVLRCKEGKEIGIIEDPAKLDHQSKKALMEELEKTYFMPQITAINEKTEKYGVSKWDVETDRGGRTFEVRSRDDIRLLDSGRVLIRDIDGNRYEIPDHNKLDPQSHSYLDAEL